MTDLHPKRLSLAALPSEELRTLLRESGDPDVLLAAAELLKERGDSAFLPPDTEAALRRFRRDFLPTTKLDPDARETAGTSRLWRILPLAAIVVTIFAMLAYAGQQREAGKERATAILHQGTQSDIFSFAHNGTIPSFSIALPNRFALEGTTFDDATGTVLYRDVGDASRSVSLSFETGPALSYAAKDPDHYPPEDITLPNFFNSCMLTDFGDTIEIEGFNPEPSTYGYLVVIVTHGLTREEAIAVAESLSILPEGEWTE